MPFKIPNSDDAAYAGQASPDAVDIDILVAGHDLTGVLSGCAVTPSSGMVIAVATGTVVIAGKPVSVASGTLTVGANASGFVRYDLVVVNTSGTKSIQAGTGAANPVFPPIPANSVVIAAVYVPNGASSIASNQITDKRVPIRLEDEWLAYTYF